MNINDGILDLERKDLEDPVINIAMGVRWISYKYSCIGKGVKKDLYNTVKYYYDKNEGDEYATKVFSLYHLTLNEALQNKKYLKLPHGREVLLVRLFNEIDPSNHMRLFLRGGKRVLWDVTFHEDLGTVWADAHFIPLYDKEFMGDLNGDGMSEIAVAVWHVGNAIQKCKAIIFSVNNKKLTYLSTKKINYEFSRSIFKNKAEAKNNI